LFTDLISQVRTADGSVRLGSPFLLYLSGQPEGNLHGILEELKELEEEEEWEEMVYNIDVKFEVLVKSKRSRARAGRLITPHGEVDTPAFFPVGTQGTVKTMTPKSLIDIGVQGMLCNTYHLYLRPGPDLIEEAGGLHKFIGWDRAIITDSGGYQVFSIKDLKKVSDEGVEFTSHIDGSKHLFTPEKVMEIERAFGPDVMMPLDECAPYPSDHKDTLKAVKRTSEWAKRSKSHLSRLPGGQASPVSPILFGIIQGGVYNDLREKSAKEIMEIGFPGYAIGGLSVAQKSQRYLSPQSNDPRRELSLVSLARRIL
jgi:queuine tRNA-ribosyltransferase